MGEIPEKCRHWKVARNRLFAWWCRGVCGRLRGKLCEPWCRLAEHHGLWTLWLTLGVPLAVLLALAYVVARGLWER